MNETPPWLPPLIILQDFDGNWDRYCDALYSIFHKDFIASQPQFLNRYVRCRRNPIMDGKEAGFWHCISEGKDEQERTPNFRRCERIGWIRPILENNSDPLTRFWRREKRSDKRAYLWYRDEYLIVLGERKRFFQLITAFCTDQPHTKKKLEKEYARSRNG